MNGIDRRSQRVICVCKLTVCLEDGGTLSNDPRVPQKWAVYTVDDFVPAIFVPGFIGPQPGITLREVQTPVCCVTEAPSGWPIIAFRPVDERKTGIGELVRAGRIAGLHATYGGPLKKRLTEDA